MHKVAYKGVKPAPFAGQSNFLYAPLIDYFSGGSIVHGTKSLTTEGFLSTQSEGGYCIV